ncbi:MAG: hypothetical protein JJE04_21640 [Acidobacteriia bacterium]|nr:hypothetical protein [Terriglobia bacterium]
MMTMAGLDEKPGQLPGLVVDGSNPLRVLANCYVVCRECLGTLIDAYGNDAELHNLYLDKRKTFLALLAANGGRVWRLRNTDALLGELRATDGREAVVRVAALLWALDSFLKGALRQTSSTGRHKVRASHSLGGEEFDVAARITCPITERVKKKPRMEEHVSDMLTLFHPSLLITPVKVKEWGLRAVMLPRGAEELLAARCKRGDLKIAVCPMSSDAVIQKQGESGRFVVTSTGDTDPQITALRNVLAKSRDEGVSILVLPELRMPAALVDAAVDFLRRQRWEELSSGKGILLLVAGSWHVEDGDGWVNRSKVLDYRGEMVWAHDKMAEYHELQPSEERERIRRGMELQYCDSPAGRMTVAICVGFFHKPLEELLIASGADLFLVPAMTLRVRSLVDRARELVRSQHGSTFVANCGKVGTGNELCFYLIPKAGAGPVYAGATDDLHVFDLTKI